MPGKNKKAYKTTTKKRSGKAGKTEVNSNAVARLKREDLRSSPTRSNFGLNR